MEEKIKEAIKLLRENNYFVHKIPDNLCDTAENCCETGYGDCCDCSCFVCLVGND